MTASVTLEGPENLIAHIEGLQATLTKRNAEIERLTQERDDALDGEPTDRALNAAYKRGWNACAAAFGESGRAAAQLASQISATMRAAHIDLYDQAQSKNPYREATT